MSADELIKKNKTKNKIYIIPIFFAIIATAISVIVIFASPVIYSVYIKTELRLYFSSISYYDSSTTINIHVVDVKEPVMLYSKDFVLKINNTSTSADCFIYDELTRAYAYIDEPQTILVCFNHSKETINTPVELYVKGKKLELNKTVEI